MELESLEQLLDCRTWAADYESLWCCGCCSHCQRWHSCQWSQPRNCPLEHATLFEGTAPLLTLRPPVDNWEVTAEAGALSLSGQPHWVRWCCRWGGEWQVTGVRCDSVWPAPDYSCQLTRAVTPACSSLGQTKTLREETILTTSSAPDTLLPIIIHTNKIHSVVLSHILIEYCH